MSKEQIGSIVIGITTKYHPKNLKNENSSKFIYGHLVKVRYDGWMVETDAAGYPTFVRLPYFIKTSFPWNNPRYTNSNTL